jgi:hypothetical protein
MRTTYTSGHSPIRLLGTAGRNSPRSDPGEKDGFMDKERLTEYIKWLLSQLDEIDSNDIDKGTVKTMLKSIIGEMYTHG